VTDAVRPLSEVNRKSVKFEIIWRLPKLDLAEPMQWAAVKRAGRVD
jgi:hypothetical protein